MHLMSTPKCTPSWSASNTCVGACFLKKTPTQVLSCEICGIFNSTLFYRTPFYSDCFCVFGKSGENFSPQQLRKSHVDRFLMSMTNSVMVNLSIFSKSNQFVGKNYRASDFLKQRNKESKFLLDTLQ